MMVYFSEICLQPGTMGCIESDSTEMSWPCQDPLDAVDGKSNGDMDPKKRRLDALQNGLFPCIHTFGRLLINMKTNLHHYS